MTSPLVTSPAVKSRSFNPFNRSKEIATPTVSSTQSSAATSPSNQSAHRFHKPRPFHKLTRSRSAKLDESVSTPTSAQSQRSPLDGFDEEDDLDAEPEQKPIAHREVQLKKLPGSTSTRPHHVHSSSYTLAPPVDISSETESQVSTSSNRRQLLHSHRQASPHKRGRSAHSTSSPSSRPTSRDPTLTLNTAAHSRSHHDSPVKERASTMFLSSFKSGSNNAAGRVTDFFSRTFRRDSSSTRDEKAAAAAGTGGHDDGIFRPKVLKLPLLEQARKTRPIARIQDAEDKTQIWMPALAWRAIQYLNERAVKEEGLYRISGSQKEVIAYQKRFDTELDINLLEDRTLFDPNTISTLFKAWLRELPEDIFPRSMQIHIMRVTPGSPMYLSEEERSRMDATTTASRDVDREEEAGSPLSQKSSAISLSSSTANAILSSEDISRFDADIDGDGDEDRQTSRDHLRSQASPSMDSSTATPKDNPSRSHPLPSLPHIAQPNRSTEHVSQLLTKPDPRVNSPIPISDRAPTPSKPFAHQPSKPTPATAHQPTYLSPTEPIPPALLSALHSLPPQNYYLLFATTAHLAHLLKYQSQNKMSLSNLMICIGPALRIENFILGWLLERWRDCWVCPEGGTAGAEAGMAGEEEETGGGPRGEDEFLEAEIEWEEQRDGVFVEDEGDEEVMEGQQHGGAVGDGRNGGGHHVLRKSVERLGLDNGR